MRQLCIALALSTAMVCHGPVEAETVVLKPTSKWHVDFGEERCRLARTFSDGRDDHLLYFEQNYPSNAAGVTVGGRSFARFKDRAETEVQIADGRAPLKTLPHKGELDRNRSALIYANLNLALDAQPENLRGLGPAVPRLNTAFADTVAYLSFRQREREVRFDTGPLGSAFKILNQCSESFLEFWGLDVEQHRGARRLPRWINDEEVERKIVKRYPAAALIASQGGITRMRVIVDERGMPESCVIEKSTTADSLKSPACQIMMKDARFEPAVDAGGKPMRSFFATTLTYQMR
jgi:hypothetical protein